MKYTSKIFILLFSMGVVLQTSCVKEKFNTPSQIIPEVDFTSTLTIAQLKSAYSGSLDSIGDTLIIPGDTIINPVIQGIVSADDESGNIYKTLYIQDNTGGIQIAIDKTSLYTIYKIGQKVLVKCSGMYLGNYGGVVQLGYIYGGAIGRLPDILIDKHLFKDSLPGPAPIPLERTVTSVSGNDMNMLVVLRNVHFAEVGSVYAQTEITTNRTVLDSLGNPIILRNSGYANFRANLLPKGQGDLVGILSAYNGTNQFYIRDLNDLQNWDTTITFPTNIIDESFATSLGSFTQYSVIGTQIWSASSYGGTTYAKMSGYESGYFANEDWLISSSLNFDNYTLETLSFQSAMKYGSPGDGTLKIFTSNNYSGTGDPNLATWNEITTAVLSPGNFVFTPSGSIDLSGITGTNVRFAFKYTCGTSGVPTWEVTTIKLSAKPN